MDPGGEEPDEWSGQCRKGTEWTGRQNGDGAEHGGEDFGFCSGAKGSLWRIVIGKIPKIGYYRSKQG